MKKYSKESLGPYWKKELNIGDEVEIQLMGTTKETPSLSQIGTYLKMPLTLFKYLDLSLIHIWNSILFLQIQGGFPPHSTSDPLFLSPLLLY